nr:hypothetical protein [Chlamydiota bacterium]
GQKALYYQGWFKFPLGHYKDLFEAMNKSSYWKHGYRLEHWFDPAGKYVDLAKLRTVTEEAEVDIYRQPDEEVLVVGEQLRKSRMLERGSRENGKYPTFIPPGRYSVDHPWDYEYEKISTLEKATVRNITCPISDQKFHEVELLFRSSRNGKLHRFIVGGVNLQHLPQLPVENYARGLYMPMGIGVSPFYQSYKDLELAPPSHSPYYSLLLDENDRWINHHEVAIDGPILHRDASNSNIVHLYLMSYERQSLVGHFVFSLETL